MRLAALFLFLLFLWPWAGSDASMHKERVASAVSQIGIVPTIVIDAGHGGANLGAHIRNPFCEEKRLTLLTARTVKKNLSQLGYHVVMTRSMDSFVPLPRRVEIANLSHADLFVSIHYNSSRTPVAQGIEVYFSDRKDRLQKTNSSHRLARSILTRIVRRTKAHSRGVKKADFFVIRETAMPAVLVEGGFISNVEERARLKDPLYLESIARGIADGIDNYFKK